MPRRLRLWPDPTVRARGQRSLFPAVVPKNGNNLLKQRHICSSTSGLVHYAGLVSRSEQIDQFGRGEMLPGGGWFHITPMGWGHANDRRVAVLPSTSGKAGASGAEAHARAGYNSRFSEVPVAEITSIRDRIKDLDARREALWGYL